jgi:hypothetical protein
MIQYQKSNFDQDFHKDLFQLEHIITINITLQTFNNIVINRMS